MAWLFQILTTVASDPSGLAMIYAGRVISGVGVGAISAVAPAYVSECSPKEVRGRITGIFQLMVKTLGSYTFKTINTRAYRLVSASWFRILSTVSTLSNFDNIKPNLNLDRCRWRWDPHLHRCQHMEDTFWISACACRHHGSWTIHH